MLQFKAITAVLESDGYECERAFERLLRQKKTWRLTSGFYLVCDQLNQKLYKKQ